MSIKTEQDLNALVYFDDRYLQRIVDVIGADVTKFMLENSTPIGAADPARFICTMTEAGVGTTEMVNSVTAGEKLTITTAANEYDGINAQAHGESFKLDTSKKLYFGCKISIDDATQSDFLVGIAETDTTLLNAAGSHAIALGGDGVFFSKLDGSTTIAAKMYKNGAETSSADYGTAMGTSATWYEIYWDRETVYFYVNNTLVTSTAASLADNDMMVSINFRNGSAAVRLADIHQLKCFQW